MIFLVANLYSIRIEAHTPHETYTFRIGHRSSNTY